MTMLLCLLATLVSVITPAMAQNDTSNTFTNPLVHLGGQIGGADPWVIRHDGFYYMTYTTVTNITIMRSPVLTDWSEAEVKLAFDPPVSYSR